MQSMSSTVMVPHIRHDHVKYKTPINHREETVVLSFPVS